MRSGGNNFNYFFFENKLSKLTNLEYAYVLSGKLGAPCHPLSTPL